METDRAHYMMQPLSLRLGSRLWIGRGNFGRLNLALFPIGWLSIRINMRILAAWIFAFGFKCFLDLVGVERSLDAFRGAVLRDADQNGWFNDHDFMRLKFV